MRVKGQIFVKDLHVPSFALGSSCVQEWQEWWGSAEAVRGKHWVVRRIMVAARGYYCNFKAFTVVCFSVLVQFTPNLVILEQWRVREEGGGVEANINVL